MFHAILLAALITGYAHAQVSDREALAAIHRHIEAAGGMKAHEDIQTISRVGTIHFFLPDKVYGYATRIVYPKHLREDLRNKDEIFVSRGSNGTSFWSWDGSKYDSVSDPALIQQLKETAQMANRDLLWAESELGFLKVAPAPQWAKGNSCYQGDKKQTFLCFDKGTGLLAAKGSDDEYRLFSKWTRAKHLSVPLVLTHFQKGKKVYQVDLKSVLENEPIETSIFDQPAKFSRSP